MKKDSKVQNELSQTIEKYNEESTSTQSKNRQNALIPSKVFEQEIDMMAVICEDMDIEVEQKDNTIQPSEKQKRLPDSEVFEETSELRINKLSSKRKSDRIIDRLNRLPIVYKYNKNKKQ